MYWEDGGDEAMLVFNCGYNRGGLKSHALCFRGESDLVCAWSDRDFGVRAKGEALEHLRRLKDALYAGDVALLCSSRFLMRGFNLIIVDKFPADLDAEWVDKQQADRDLKQK